MTRTMNQTYQRLINGDARDLSFLEEKSIHLVVTSPPYWNLKRYNENPDQLGHIDDYESFLIELEKVWHEIYRILVPGGRLVCVVGDVCVSRRKFGRHLVFPLHADICVSCRKIGFDNLNPIIWYKIANASFEVSNGSKFLGKPYEPNSIIKGLRVRVWVILYLFEHTSEDFQSEILLVAQTVSPSLDHPNLVVQPFDKT